jgi:hypothetical protein
MAALSGLLVSGCQPVGAARPASPGTTSAAASTASAGTPSAPTTAASTTPASTATPAGASSVTATVPSTTTTTGLVPASLCTIGVTTGPQEAGAGSVFTPIIFTNLGKAPCRLTGRARLEYVAADGQTAIGSGYVIAGGTGTLDPSASITTTMRTGNTDAYDEGNCKPQPVGGLRVWPPGDADPTVIHSPAAAAFADGGPLDAQALPNPGGSQVG